MSLVKKFQRDELKRHLNLLRVLANMHMRSNDYRTFLGALWSLLGPLITFTLLYYVTIDCFGKGINLFSLKLLTGIIAVNFFNSVVRIVMSAVRQSREVAVDCLVPSEIFIAAPLVVPLVKFGVEMSLCLAVSAAMGAFRFSNLPWILLTALSFSLSASGVGLVLGVLDFWAADVNEIWSRIETLILVITPVFYSVRELPEAARRLELWINPVTPFVLALQQFVSNDAVPGFDATLAVRGLVYTAALLAGGYWLLKKFEKQILEIV